MSRRGVKAGTLAARASRASTRARREAAHALNEAIDSALLHRASGAQRMLEAQARRDVVGLADRVRLRAKRLAKSHAMHRSQILDAAAGLVLAVYRYAGPRDWMCGFCDASAAPHDEGRGAGIGGVIFDGSGRTVARFARPTSKRNPFEAEIAALEATLDAAAALGDGAPRLRVYTDCDALVALWLQRRRDPRLQGVRALARRLRGFQLYSLPRRHNQAAHHLARHAACAIKARDRRVRDQGAESQKSI